MNAYTNASGNPRQRPAFAFYDACFEGPAIKRLFFKTPAGANFMAKPPAKPMLLQSHRLMYEGECPGHGMATNGGAANADTTEEG